MTVTDQLRASLRADAERVTAIETSYADVLARASQLRRRRWSAGLATAASGAVAAAVVAVVTALPSAAPQPAPPAGPTATTDSTWTFDVTELDFSRLPEERRPKSSVLASGIQPGRDFVGDSRELTFVPDLRVLHWLDLRGNLCTTAAAPNERLFDSPWSCTGTNSAWSEPRGFGLGSWDGPSPVYAEDGTVLHSVIRGLAAADVATVQGRTSSGELVQGRLMTAPDWPVQYFEITVPAGVQVTAMLATDRDGTVKTVDVDAPSGEDSVEPG
ncbi:MAG: hypothetical protein JWM93_1079 [Frankiales bacterium]|nr:hypothetical protein [Frankiales bacterium]